MTTVGISTAGAVAKTKTEWSRWAGITGIVFGLLLVASTLMTAGMPDTKNPAKVEAWDVKHTGLLTGSAMATFAAVIIGLFFLTWLHSQLAGREGGWMGTMFVAGTVVFAMSGATTAGINASVGADAKHLNTGSLQLMSSVNTNLTYVMTCIGLAALFLGAGGLIRRSRLLPGWLAWASWVFAAFAATFVLGFVALIGSVLWVIVIGTLLMVRQPVES